MCIIRAIVSYLDIFKFSLRDLVFSLCSQSVHETSANMKQTSNYFAVLSLDDEDEEDDTDRQFTPPSSDAPPSVGSPLIDKAPAEIRLKIFALVLQASRSVVNVSNLPPYKRGHR